MHSDLSVQTVPTLAGLKTRHYNDRWRTLASTGERRWLTIRPTPPPILRKSIIPKDLKSFVLIEIHIHFISKGLGTLFMGSSTVAHADSKGVSRELQVAVGLVFRRFRCQRALGRAHGRPGGRREAVLVTNTIIHKSLVLSRVGARFVRRGFPKWEGRRLSELPAEPGGRPTARDKIRRRNG